MRQNPYDCPIDGSYCEDSECSFGCVRLANGEKTAARKEPLFAELPPGYSTKPVKFKLKTIKL